MSTSRRSASVPDEPDDGAQQEEQRVLRRRGVGGERRLHPVEQLPAPDEVVVGVVVGIRRDERPRRPPRRPAPRRTGAGAHRAGARVAAAASAPSGRRRRRRSPSGRGRPPRAPMPSEEHPGHRVFEERRRRASCGPGAPRTRRRRRPAGVPRAPEEPPQGAREHGEVGDEPDAPCSAATVIGIVCDAEVARSAETCSCAGTGAGTTPRPSPDRPVGEQPTPPEIRS